MCYAAVLADNLCNFIRATETSRNITARVIERDTSGEIYYFLEDSRRFRTRQHGCQLRQNCRQVGRQLSPKMMPTWLYRQDFAKFSLNPHYNVRGGIACE
ncbi:hypothetical protein TNCV_3924181 [Trichonephila clavipes]|nr:hypothetical protein TNCV_3924181 [Trichonephila clavipes]